MVYFHDLLALTALVSVAWAAPAATCEPQEVGKGPLVSPDTAEAFQSYPEFGRIARAAKTPEGYVQVYKDLTTTYNEPRMFVGYFTMAKYDVEKCAQVCSANSKCDVFTIFFERAPSVQPTARYCPNPPSTTLIKCDLWSGKVLSSIALNYGQYREAVHVVMAGSNGYVRDVPSGEPSFPGWSVESLGAAAIEAPLDCKGKETYMGLRYWHDGKFDIERCLDACDAAQGPKCVFVNTYVQRQDGVPYSQHCAMYSAHWPKKYATNVGQWRGEHRIDIQSTNSFGITRDDGKNHDACLPKLPLMD